MTKEKERYLERLKSFQYIDSSICKNCGGECCKKESCTLFPCDVHPFTFEKISNLIDNKHVSIKAFFKSGKLIPYLTIMGIDYKIFAFLPPFASCSLLTTSGCKLSSIDRPLGALHLLPSPRMYPYCNSVFSIEEIIEMWEQEHVFSVMTNIIKHYSKGSSVKEIVYTELHQFEQEVLTNKCHLVPFYRYQVYQYGLISGYRFNERTRDLIFS